jgi:hypothetical protein
VVKLDAPARDRAPFVINKIHTGKEALTMNLRRTDCVFHRRARCQGDRAEGDHGRGRDGRAKPSTPKSRKSSTRFRAKIEAIDKHLKRLKIVETRPAEAAFR